MFLLRASGIVGSLSLLRADRGLGDWAWPPSEVFPVERIGRGETYEVALQIRSQNARSAAGGPVLLGSALGLQSHRLRRRRGGPWTSSCWARPKSLSTGPPGRWVGRGKGQCWLTWRSTPGMSSR